MQPSPLDDVLVFLLAAVVVVSLFKYMKISSVIGYLIAGAIIGPSAFALIDNVEDTQRLADIGVVFLLFSIGLKMSLSRLRSLSYYVFGLGFAQFTVTGAIITAIFLLFDLPANIASLLGLGLALSSTAVSMQILGETGETSSRYGRISFAILLAQDLAVILLLVLRPTLDSPGDQTIIEMLSAAAVRAVLVLLGIWFFGRFILRPVYRIIANLKNQELFSATSLLIVLGLAMTTEHADLSMELGAFLAGLLIAETEYRHQVEADISPFHGLLLGLFFMNVGMKMSPSIIINDFALIFSIIVGMISIKSVITFILALLFKIPVGCALKSSLLLATGGEFIFILLTPEIESGLVSEQLGNAIVVAVAISMMLTPFLANLAKIIEGRNINTESEVSLKSAISEVGDLKDHVIIVGFSKIGQLVAQIIQKQMISYVAIDNDMNNVTNGRNNNFQVFYGDARRNMVLRTLGAAKAKSIIICMNDDNSAMRTTLMIRHNFQDANVFVYLQNNDFAEKVTKSGAQVIIPQNIEPGLQLANFALTNHGLPTEQSSRIINDYRDQMQNQKEEIVEETDIDKEQIVITSKE